MFIISYSISCGSLIDVLAVVSSNFRENRFLEKKIQWIDTFQFFFQLLTNITKTFECFPEILQNKLKINLKS